jgi:beta-lactamase class A
VVKSHFFRFLFVLVFFFIAVSLVGFIWIRKKEAAFHKLEKEILGLAQNREGRFSFLIEDLSFPYRRLAYNQDKEFPAASLIKLPLVAVAFGAVQEGRVSLSDNVIIESKDITGGSGVIKKKKLPLRLTFGELCRLSIVHSDNTATNKIIDILGFDYINTGFKHLGLKTTSLKRKMMDFYARKQGIENYTTASDIAYLLKRIYRGRLINKEFCKFIISFLKNQKISDRIPRFLPQDAIVAHKTGTERGVVHDAGIVFAPKGDYIICVFTQDVKSYREAKNFIAKTSLLAYNLYR